MMLDSLADTKVGDHEWWLERVHVWRVVLQDYERSTDPDDDEWWFGVWKNNHPVDGPYDDEFEVLDVICRGEGVAQPPDDCYRGLRT
jgi:hypothetical protein